MAYSSDRTISIDQLFGAVKRHKLLGATVFAAVFGMVVLAWLFLPKEYGSQGQLFVKLGGAQQNTTTATTQQSSVSIQDTPETEIRSVAELLKSQAVLGQVVDNIGADKILSNDLKLPFLGMASTGGGIDGMTTEEYQKARQREKAIKKLSSKLNIFTEKKTSVISVYCTAASPKLAQEVVTELMDSLKRLHANVYSAKPSRVFYAREYASQKTVVEKIEKSLQAWRDENKFLSVAHARNTWSGVLDKLENQQIDVSVDLSQSMAMISELEHQSKTIDRDVMTPTAGIESAATAGAQQLLNARIAERARLLAKYSRSNPKVVEINQEIRRLETEVSDLPTDRTESGRVQNPVYEELKVSLVTERSRAKGFESRLRHVNLKHAEAEKRLVELNRLEVEGARLQRDLLVAKTDLAFYAKKRSESKVIDSLNNESISDVEIAQHASLQLKKHSPKGSVMLPIGFLFANLCGLFAAIFADRKQLTGLTTPDEIEDALDIPVLVTIPRVHSSRVLTN